MRGILRKLFRHPPWWLRPLWRRWLLRSTGRLLRKEGVHRLVCYDIGARWGLWSRFHLLPLPIYKVGFEADPLEAERLVKTGVFDSVVPYALSAEGGKRTLYLARDQGSSSVFGPDLQLIAQHCEPDNWTVVGEIPLETITLGKATEAFKIPPPDYLKLDVEGAELEILTGGKSLLGNCSGIFFEARLAPFYPGEGLFGDVCTLLLQHGFSVTSFEPVGSYEGAIMLVDASACRNLRLESSRQKLLKSAAFALLVDNFEFALSSLLKVASKKEILIG
ncbi:MAG: methyltransferase, FkbM family [Pedosphaera sp.]|nr:methyltransferase, FkbM family [Pedosphaera sp.]